MKKKNVVGLILIIIILVVLGVIIGISSKGNKEIEELQENYALIKKDNKYGVIDKNANIIVEAQYDMIQIANPEKPVFVCLYDYNSETLEYKTKVLNDKMQQIYTTYNNIDSIQIKNDTEKYPYQTQVLKYQENGKYGIISIDGKKITEAKYEEIESIAYKSNVLAVKKDDKYGIIDIKGKEIIKNEYDTISADYYYNDESQYKYAGYIVSKKTDNGYRYGYIKYNGDVILKTEYTSIDRIPIKKEEKNAYLIAYKDGQAGVLKNKKIILKHEYEDIEYNTENNLMVVKRAKKYGVNAIKGDVIVPLEYDDIDIVGNCIRTEKNEKVKIYDIYGNEQTNADYVNMINVDDKYKIVVNDKNKFAIINSKNEKIIDYNYDYIEYLFDTYFIATSNNKVGIINIDNKYKIEAKYDALQKLDNADIIQAIDSEDNRVDLYNKNLDLLCSAKDAIIMEEEDYITFISNDDIRYFDNNGEEKQGKEILKNNTLFAKKQNDKWGFEDQSGNVKIECKYEKVTEFNNMGFAGIKENGLWGVVNKEGQVIVEPKYKLNMVIPNFIGEYYMIDTEYGRTYYSNEIIE